MPALLRRNASPKLRFVHPSHPADGPLPLTCRGWHGFGRRISCLRLRAGKGCTVLQTKAMRLRLFILVAALMLPGSLAAQKRSIWPEKMFEPFKENYFTTGIPLNTSPDYDTNDLAYQVSVRFNVLRLPSDWHFFWGYTQQSLWDVYMPSNPFRANTYTNGLYFYHPLKDERSELLLGYEHRSNGFDSYESRSLDYVFVNYTREFCRFFSAQFMGRFGVGSIGNDYSLEMFDRYEGYLNAALCFHTPDRRFLAKMSVTPLFKGDIPANLTAELAFQPVPRTDWFYITMRYHHGYDENQNDCACPDVFLKRMLRFGLSVQPRSMAGKLFF